MCFISQEGSSLQQEAAKWVGWAAVEEPDPTTFVSKHHNIGMTTDALCELFWEQGPVDFESR